MWFAAARNDHRLAGRLADCVALAVMALISGSLAATAATASTGSIPISKVVDVSDDQTA